MKTKLAIFGITGDLSQRKLLPALGHVIASHAIGDLEVIGVSRRDVDVEALLSGLIHAEAIQNITKVFTMDLTLADDYRGLKQFINLGENEQLLVYLSVPPSAATTIADFLGQAGINGPNVKLLFEKPFGFDLASAIRSIDRTYEYFDESQIYRIDHYMAKEIAQEIIRVRRDGKWDQKKVVAVDVVAAESIDIEGRTNFYEQTGALRDFLQGHLMQILALVLMDIPDDFTMDRLPEYRLAALDHVSVADASQAFRAQYEGYQSEVGNPGSLTETFAAVSLSTTKESCAQATLRLISGKALSEKRSYIHVVFDDGSTSTIEEGKIKTSDARLPDAYERVLLQAIKGAKELFTTGPEVIRSWEVLRPIQETWGMDHEHIGLYKKGSTIDEVLKNQ